MPFQPLLWRKKENNYEYVNDIISQNLNYKNYYNISKNILTELLKQSIYS